MKLRTALVALGLVGGAVAAERALIETWRKNPDPLNGTAPVFPSGKQRTVVTDDGAELNITDAGEGPTVVLVHGLTSSHIDMGPLAAYLVAGGFRVLGVDQRGHGASTAGSDVFSAERLGADLAQVYSDLDVENAVLVGHSMGGIAAMSFAVEHGDAFAKRTRALVIVASIGRINLVRQTLTAKFMPKKFTSRQRVGAALISFGSKPSLYMLDQGLESAGRCSYEVRVAAAKGLRNYDILARLGEITVPTMVIWGSRDRLTEPRANRAIVHHIPGSIPVEILGAGHMIIWERAEELSELIADMARVEPPLPDTTRVGVGSDV